MLLPLELQRKSVREGFNVVLGDDEQVHMLTLPNDANALGTLFGGKLMQLVDLAGALAWQERANRATRGMATYGFCGLSSALCRLSTSFIIRKPAARVLTYRVIPSVEACALWAAPKASFT